jgi:hypothetical protein
VTGTSYSKHYIKKSSSKQQARSKKDLTILDDKMWEGILGNKKEKSIT